MDREPSIEEHLTFRKLLEGKDPAALEVHATFTANHDRNIFNAGLLRVVRGNRDSKNTNINVIAKNDANLKLKPQQTDVRPAVCRHFSKLGKCKSGSNCKFLHESFQLSSKPAEQPSTPQRIAKIPLSRKNDTEQLPSRGNNLEQKVDLPISPGERSAATSRFLGLFGVRKGVDTTPSRVNNTAALDVATTAVPASASPTVTAAPTAENVPQSPPQLKSSGNERTLEDLLLDSPSTKKFWEDLEVKPSSSSFEGSDSWPTGNMDLGLDLSLRLGLGGDSKPPGFLPPPALQQQTAGAPGFSGPSFLNNNSNPPPPALHQIPTQQHQQQQQPQSSRLFPTGPGSQYGNQPPPLMQGPPNMPPGVHPPLPGMMYPMGISPPPHFPPGAFPPGMMHMGPPPPFPMPGMGVPPPLPPLHAQLGYGPPPALRQNALPAHMQVQPRPPTSHLSVHDVLGQSDREPMSPSAEERSRQLLNLLSSGSSPARTLGQEDNHALAVPVTPGTNNTGGGTSTSPFSVSISGPASSAVGGHQQKSRALLSLLKSSKVGSLSLTGTSCGSTNTSSPSSTPRSQPGTAVATTTSPALPAPPTLTKAPMPAPPAVPMPAAPPAHFSTPVKSKPKTADNGGGASDLPATPGVMATPAKKASFFRNTRFQTGSMVILVNNTSRPHHVLRPSMNMAVQWQMPQADFHTLMNRDSDLVIGLVRYGSYTNNPCFVAKQIESRPKLFRDADGHVFYQGNIVFHAPKSAGQFVYRLFDQATKESALTTLATSPIFSVELTDYHVNTNLKHIIEALAEKSKVKGISQLPAVLRGIRNPGKEDRPNGSAELMLNDCMTAVLRAIDEAIPVIDAWRDNRRKAAEDKKEADISGGNINDSSTGVATADPIAALRDIEEMRANYKQAMRVHAEAHEAICALSESRIPWNMLSDPLREAICAKESLFCPHLQRYARNLSHLQQIRFEEYGFAIAVESPRVVFTQAENAGKWARLNASIDRLVPSLMPRADFQRTRETAVAQLQLALLTEQAVPPGTEVALYGSSNNSFGSDGADMDMTLLFPANIHLKPEDKPMVIERLAAVLTRIGMSEVAPRATARIPIVMFSDPLNALECDISLQNELAVANTKLLRAYGAIDPRVRMLVFLIKNWAKNRHLNSPSDGTLSSYGFILCLLHFLQNRPVPLVPNLQSLPPTWTGQRSRDSIDLGSALNLSPSDPRSARAPSQSQAPAQAQAGLQNRQLHQQAISREEEEARQFERRSVPKVIIQSADSVPCNAYFYCPTLAQPHLLSTYAQGNSESVGELLVEFFRYYCWKFDLRRSVVSVRQPSGLTKIDKAEHDAWLQSDNLSIEDPFETHYDVAHVIKSAQMAYLRKELLRAHTLASRMFVPINNTPTASSNGGNISPGDDVLAASVDPENFLSLLCEPCEPPAFTNSARDKLAAAEGSIAVEPAPVQG